jgi:hypothetical protein
MPSVSYVQSFADCAVLAIKTGMMVLIVGVLIASIVALAIAEHERARWVADLGASRRSCEHGDGAEAACSRSKPA